MTGLAVELARHHHGAGGDVGGAILAIGLILLIAWFFTRGKGSKP